jgi:hypothetical protein
LLLSSQRHNDGQMLLDHKFQLDINQGRDQAILVEPFLHLSDQCDKHVVIRQGVFQSFPKLAQGSLLNIVAKIVKTAGNIAVGGRK